MRLILAALFTLFFANSGFDGVQLLVIFGLAYVVFGMVLGKPKAKAAPRQARPAKRQSFRSRVVTSASDSVSRGITSVLIPRKPTAQELERERQRAQTKKDYAFHTAQAARFAGTLDGEYHKNMARQARDRMK